MTLVLPPVTTAPAGSFFQRIFEPGDSEPPVPVGQRPVVFGRRQSCQRALQAEELHDAPRSALRKKGPVKGTALFVRRGPKERGLFWSLGKGCRLGRSGKRPVVDASGVRRAPVSKGRKFLARRRRHPQVFAEEPLPRVAPPLGELFLKP